MNAFDAEKLQDLVCTHGHGMATPEGIALGERMIAAGDSYVDSAAEIVAHGFITNSVQHCENGDADNMVKSRSSLFTADEAILAIRARI